MSSRKVPRPFVGAMPYTRTETLLLSLMADERNSADAAWVEQAITLTQYLHARIALYPEISRSVCRRRFQGDTLVPLDLLLREDLPVSAQGALPAEA